MRLPRYVSTHFQSPIPLIHNPKSLIFCEKLQLILEEIIGLTTKNANGLASNISTASCAYVAGCVVVVYNVDSGKQSHLMVSHRTPKPLRCVAVSQDGRFIAAGEVLIYFVPFMFDSIYLFIYLCVCGCEFQIE